MRSQTFVHSIIRYLCRIPSVILLIERTFLDSCCFNIPKVLSFFLSRVINVL